GQEVGLADAEPAVEIQAPQGGAAPGTAEPRQEPAAGRGSSGGDEVLNPCARRRLAGLTGIGSVAGKRDVGEARRGHEPAYQLGWRRVRGDVVEREWPRRAWDAGFHTVRLSRKRIPPVFPRLRGSRSAHRHPGWRAARRAASRGVAVPTSLSLGVARPG